LTASNDRENHRRSLTQPLDTRTVVETAVTEETSDIEGKCCDVVEQSLDRVALRFVSTNSSDSDDERFRPTENESSEVAMALGGAIAGRCVTEFTGRAVGTAVVVKVDEVEADDPRPAAEDHRCLLSEQAVDDRFEFFRWDGVKLSKCVVVGVRSTSVLGDRLDRGLVDGCLEDRSPNNPGVEAAAFDSGYRDLRKEAFR
jgi:hypothetical protein